MSSFDNAAFFDAIDCDDFSSFERLLPTAPSLNVVSDLDKWTPLFATAYVLKRERFMRALLDAKADTGVRDDLGDFPLLAAAQRNNVEAVKLLIAATADVDMKASDGQTALIAATEKRLDDIVHALLAAGADTELRDNSGRSAEDAARGGAIPDLALAHTIAGFASPAPEASAAPAAAPASAAAPYGRHEEVDEELFEPSSRAGALGGPTNMPAAIARAVREGLCTFTATGPAFHKQKWWKCLDCSAAAGGDFGLCETCQNCNHKTHRKTFVGVQDFYCDCGSGGGSKPCVALVPPRKEAPGADAAALDKYRGYLGMALFDGEISVKEQDLLRKARADLGVTEAQHKAVLSSFEISQEAFMEMYTRENGGAPGAAAVDPDDVMKVTAKEALVVGNSKYVQPGATLRNPFNDASAVSRELRALGFNTTVALDVMTYDEFATVVRTFIERLKTREKIDDGCVALFYFAGHAIEIKGSNYLMHGNFTSAELSSDGFTAKDATEEALSGYMSSQFILQAMEDHCNTNILILDACRNNPFKPPPKLKARGRGSGAGGAAAPAKTGLAAVYPTGSSMVVLSAAPGFTAGDGSDENKDNGMFTNSLLKYLSRADMHIEEVIFHVAKDVYTVSKGKQHPWKHTALLKRVYLAQKAARA